MSQVDKHYSRQSINLYLDEFRVKKIPFDANTIAQLFILLVAILSIITVSEYWSSYHLNRNLSLKVSEYSTQLKHTNALSESLSSQLENTDYVKEKEALENSLHSKQQLLNLLNNNEESNSSGFSNFLKDLALYHVDGMRLTELNFNQGGINIEFSGEVVKPEVLPLYIQNLKKSETFKGINFNSLQIKENETDQNRESLLEFTVKTVNI